MGGSPITKDLEKLISKSNALRLIGFLLLGLFFSNLLSRSHLVSTQTLILLLICFSFVTLVSLVGRYPVLVSVRGASVPIGLFVGVLEVFVSMVGAGDGSLAERVTAVYTPVSIGIILSYTLQIFDESPAFRTSSQREPHEVLYHLIALALLLLFASGYLAMSRDDFDIMFIFNVNSALFSVSVIALIASSSEYRTESPGRILAASGGIICIAAAVIGIATYSASVATMDPKSLGPAIHLSFAMIYVGSGLIVANQSLGGGPESNVQLRKRDWHLIESFVFLTLIILPPLTLFEVMGLQANRAG